MSVGRCTPRRPATRRTTPQGPLGRGLRALRCSLLPLVLAGCSSAAGHRDAQAQREGGPPSDLGAALTPDGRHAPRADGGSAADQAGLDGATHQRATRIVFSSNRDGSYDLFSAALDGSQVHALVTHAAADLQPAVAPDGSSVVFTSTRGGSSGLWLLELGTGALRPLVTSLRAASVPSFAPDGQTVVFEGRSSDTSPTDLYVVAVNGGTPQQRTTDSHSDAGPVFSADGRELFFVSNRSGAFEIWRMPAGGGAATVVTQQGRVVGRPAVTPDGQALVFARRLAAAADQTELVWLELAGGAVSVISGPGDSEPAISADGRWLAFTTLRFDNPELALWALPAGGPPASGSTPTRLTQLDAIDGTPTFGALAP
jgi:Tol biopolymer transport system component